MRGQDGDEINTLSRAEPNTTLEAKREHVEGKIRKDQDECLMSTIKEASFPNEAGFMTARNGAIPAFVGPAEA